MEEIAPKWLYAIEGFLSSDECGDLRAIIDERSTHGDIAQPMPNRFQEQYVDPTLATQLWDKIQPFVGALGVRKVSDTMPIIRYQVDGRATVIHQDPRRAPNEKYGVLFYLNDDFPDGETVFYDRKIQPLQTITPRTGLAVVFSMDARHKGLAPNGVKYLWCVRLCA